MQPGEEYTVGMTHQRPGGRQTPQGYAKDPPSNLFVIATVTFADDTYEGNQQTALEMIAEDKGRQTELKRILLLIQKAIDSAEPDEAKAFDELGKQITALRTDPDESVMVDLAARFPGLTPPMDKNVRETVMRGSQSSQHLVTSTLGTFRPCVGRARARQRRARWPANPYRAPPWHWRSRGRRPGGQTAHRLPW